MRCSMEKPRTTEPVYSTTWPTRAGGADGVQDAERGVLRGDTRRQRPLDAHLHGERPRLAQTLRREHVLDLGGADAEREGAESAVRGRVRVAADDDAARLRQPQLRADDVHDALPAVAGAEAGDAALVAVALQRVHLRAGSSRPRR